MVPALDRSAVRFGDRTFTDAAEQFANRSDWLMQQLTQQPHDRFTSGVVLAAAVLNRYGTCLERGGDRVQDCCGVRWFEVHFSWLSRERIVGLLAGIPALCLLAQRVRKRGLLTVAPFLAIVPLILLDILFGVLPNGMLLLGVALGFFAFREQSATPHSGFKRLATRA